MPAKVQLTGGAFQDSEGNVLANGTLVFELSQDASVSGVGNIISGIKITINLDINGNVDQSTAQFIWGNDQMLPLNTYYRVTGFAANGQPAWGPNNQQVVGVGTFNVGTWVPNQVVSWNPPSNSSIALQHNGITNGSQTKLNLVAGSGMSVTDDGAGDITLIATGGTAAGSLTGSVVTFSTNATPQTLDVSPEGVLDWFIPFPTVSNSTGAVKSLAASNVAGSIAKNFRQYGGTITNATNDISTTVHSDTGDTAGLAYAAANSANCQSQADTINFNYGFALEVPASTSVTRNLNLYIVLWGGAVGQSRTAKVVASLSDGSAADVTLTQVDGGANANISVYKANFQFKCGIAGSVLRIQVFATAGTSGSNLLGLLAATLF